jgi:hypothetical protein
MKIGRLKDAGCYNNNQTVRALLGRQTKTKKGSEHSEIILFLFVLFHRIYGTVPCRQDFITRWFLKILLGILLLITF